MSILAPERCLGVCCSVRVSSPQQLLFQARIFLPFDCRGREGWGVTSPQSPGYREDFQRVGTHVLWVGSFESQPGPVLPAVGADSVGPTFTKPLACPGLLGESLLRPGRAGASGVQSAQLQETGRGKGLEWLVGVWLLA